MQDEFWRPAVDASCINPRSTFLDVPVVRGQVEKVFPVRKEIGPPIRRVPRPVESRDGNRLAARGRHAINCLVDVWTVENDVSRPCSPSRVGCWTQVHRWTASKIQPLELLVGEKANGLTVRRPKGEFTAFGAG